MELPPDWRAALGDPDLGPIARAVAAERARGAVLPAEPDVLAAFAATPFASVRVVLLGQDPYPTAGHAHGLAFSVRPGVAPPPSLRNLFRERETDLGLPPPRHGHLRAWAERGMLLLNTILTVREGEAGSHAGLGWEPFTDRALRALDDREGRIVFVLLGAHARKKAPLVRSGRHAVLEGVHPSPLSARNGFFGSRPFSAVDRLLGAPFDWSLPDAGSTLGSR